MSPAPKPTHALAPRKLLAEAAIGLAIVGGAYALFVEPVERELTAVRAAVRAADQHAQADADSPKRPEVARATIETSRELRAAVSAKSRLATNDALMFSAIAQLAAQHNVTIERLDPLQDPIPQSRTDRKSAGESAVRCDLVVTGSYASAAAFAGALARHAGFAVVRNLEIEPLAEPGKDAVRLTLETEHWAFDVAAILADALPQTPERP